MKKRKKKAGKPNFELLIPNNVETADFRYAKAAREFNCCLKKNLNLLLLLCEKPTTIYTVRWSQTMLEFRATRACCPMDWESTNIPYSFSKMLSLSKYYLSSDVYCKNPDTVARAES